MSELAPLSPYSEQALSRNAKKAGATVNWRQTHIATTEGAAQSQPYSKDSAMADVDRRQTLHAILDKICCRKNYTTDKAGRLHAALGRYLDREGVPAEEEPELEPAEEEVDAEPEAETRRTRKQHTGDSMSFAMDAGKCSACKIPDNKPATGKAASVQSIIDFWNANGIHLREA